MPVFAPLTGNAPLSGNAPLPGNELVVCGTVVHYCR